MESSPRKTKRRNSKTKAEADKDAEMPAERDGSDELLVMEEECVTKTFDPIPFPDGRWDVHSYGHHIKIHVVNQSADGMDLDFDLVNVEAPIANALRRILISEVPTMAIEKVYLYQNTSVIQDEVLCHRLGLIPIHADATKFAFPVQKPPQLNQPINTDIVDQEPPGDPKVNLVFELHAVCPSQKDAKKKKSSKDGDEAIVESIVKEPSDSGNWVLYSSGFKWIPIGDQKARFSKDLPRLVHNDIILAKMRPGQEIEARCHCVKGIGRDHAKFSPVATATYRMLPQIRLKRHNFDDDQAERLQSSFSKGVIGREKGGRVYVKDARKDTSSRNIFRHEDLKDAVEMSKKKTHFIFSVESVGAAPADKLVIEACAIMKDKMELLRRHISNKLGQCML